MLLPATWVCGDSSLPEARGSMADLDGLLRALESGKTAFSYAHFNDGEVKALTCRRGEMTSRAKQPCSPELNRAMHVALTKRSPNFYLGIVCPCVWSPQLYLKVLNILNGTDTWYSNSKTGNQCSPVSTRRTWASDNSLQHRITSGNLFAAANYHYAKSELSRILRKASFEQGRRVHVVTGAGKGMKNENANVSGLPFPVASHHTATHFDAFHHSYKRMRPREFLINAGANSGDIVLLMGGPLGRILASEWAHLHTNITILDLGSFWNEELYGKESRVADIDDPVPCFWQTDFNYTQTHGL